MKFALVFLCIVGYAHSQTNCGTCFPGTSASQCGYRKPADPIICASDGKKYTPCTFTCVRKCNTSLRITGCGATCISTSGTTCPDTVTAPPPTAPPTAPPTGPATIPPVTCLPTTDTVKCPAFVPANPAPTSACTAPQTIAMKDQCTKCPSDSAVVGKCDPVATSTLCIDKATGICAGPIVAPAKHCDVDPKPLPCTQCLAPIGECTAPAGYY